jgi:hypothetical protein
MRNLLCVALLLGGIAYAQTSLTPLVAKQRQLYFRINPKFFGAVSLNPGATVTYENLRRGLLPTHVEVS